MTICSTSHGSLQDHLFGHSSIAAPHVLHNLWELRVPVDDIVGMDCALVHLPMNESGSKPQQLAIATDHFEGGLKDRLIGPAFLKGQGCEDAVLAI